MTRLVVPGDRVVHKMRRRYNHACCTATVIASHESGLLDVLFDDGMLALGRARATFKKLSSGENYRHDRL